MIGKRHLDGKEFGRSLWREVKDDHVGNGAAALAFYLVLGLFPAAIFGLSLLPYLPIPHLRDAIMDLVREALPGSAADLLTGTIDSILSQRRGGLLSFGFVLTLWSASSGLHAVMQELNVVYDVRERRSFLRARLTALCLTLAFFVLVVGALGLVVFGGMMQSAIGEHLGWSRALLMTFAALRYVIIVGALFAAFALVYYFGPNVKQTFRGIVPGSLFATIGLLVASVGFNVYVAHFARFNAVYGSLGAVIVLLLWLFIAGWVILLGGEINDVLERRTGARGGLAGDAALRRA